MLEMKTQKY